MISSKNTKLKFLKLYFEDFISHLSTNNNLLFKKLINVAEILEKTRTKKNKIIIAGNGGSAAISSHFSVDLTKNAKVRCINFNEADLITCFANDYGYENWIMNALKFYSNKDDILILVSVSGESKNILNAAKNAKKFGIKKIITLTGSKKNNPLRKYADIDFWINSKSYNIIENYHQFLLLTIVDLIIGKSEYKPK